MSLCVCANAIFSSYPNRKKINVNLPHKCSILLCKHKYTTQINNTINKCDYQNGGKGGLNISQKSKKTKNERFFLYKIYIHIVYTKKRQTLLCTLLFRLPSFAFLFYVKRQRFATVVLLLAVLSTSFHFSHFYIFDNFFCCYRYKHRYGMCTAQIIITDASDMRSFCCVCVVVYRNRRIHSLFDICRRKIREASRVRPKRKC